MGSKVIKGFKYNPGCLKLEFQNSTEYEYYFVPKWVTGAIETSVSAGKFFNKNIKNNYPSKRIR